MLGYLLINPKNMNVFNRVNVLILFLFLNFSLYAQDGYDYTEGIQLLYKKVFNGDTIPSIDVPEITVSGLKFNSINDKNKYEFYLKKVKKVYPYYKIANEVISEMEEEKNNLKKRAFNKYKRERKKDLMREFEKEIRDLRVSEGKVLVKMINRNTGTTFHDLLREYNSGFKTWVYNIAAKRYGYELKETYNPEDEDNRMLEIAIQQVLKSNQDL